MRASPVVPLHNIGLDCFEASFYIEDNQTAAQKLFVIIFPCLIIRAIHLEIVDDKSDDQILQGLIRFSRIRRTPQFIVSDNGTNFTFIQPLLGKKVELNHAAIREYVRSNKVDWHFIPAYNPWLGGSK